MQIILLSVGKANDKDLDVCINNYIERIQHYFNCKLYTIGLSKKKNSPNTNDQKKDESIAILNSLTKDDYLILLDETGKQLTSIELANFILQRTNESKKRIVFLIGGAFGVDESIFKRANFIWSLSKLVFPHMLVRLLLAEQVYRACTIINNEKYHHI